MDSNPTAFWTRWRECVRKKKSQAVWFSCWLIIYLAPPPSPPKTSKAALRWAGRGRCTHAPPRPSRRAHSSPTPSLSPSSEERTSVLSSRSCAAPTCRSDETLPQSSSPCRRWGTTREPLSLRSSARPPPHSLSTPDRRQARPVPLLLLLLLPQMELRSSD